MRFQTNIPLWMLWVFRLAALTCTVVLLCIAGAKNNHGSNPHPIVLHQRVVTTRSKLLALPTSPEASNLLAASASVSALFSGRDSTKHEQEAFPAASVPSASAAEQHLLTAATYTTSDPTLAQVPSEPQLLEADPPTPGLEAPQPAYFALCLAVKTEEVDELRFWISYHARLGVGKFYIYDDTPVSAAPQLCDFIDRGLVEYTQPQQRLGQLGVYASCIANPASRQHRFMGFIDHDEFLVIRDPSAADLPSLLQRYEGKYGGIGVNWRLFGSSGQEQKPSGAPTHNFWRCLPGSDPQSRHIKSIVDMSKVAGVGRDPHSFQYSAGSYAALTSGRRVDGPISDEFVDDALVLYHYITKSREEYVAKMRRGSGMGNHRQWNFFDEMNAKATDNCTDLLGSLPLDVPPAACSQGTPPSLS